MVNNSKKPFLLRISVLEQHFSMITIVSATIAIVIAPFYFSIEAFAGITCALLSLIVVNQIITNHEIANLNKKLTNLKIDKFNNVGDATKYLFQRMGNVQKSVDQLSIGKLKGRPFDLKENYEKARENLISSERVTYRYIGLLSGEREFSNIFEILERGFEQDSEGFEGFYVKFKEHPIGCVPLLSFIVFDGQEIFTQLPASDNVGERPIYLSIKSEEISKLFSVYFMNLFSTAENVKGIEDIKKVKDRLNELKRT